MFLRPDNGWGLWFSRLRGLGFEIKKARKITAVQYRVIRILSVYVEPCGLCAMMFSLWGGQSDTHNAVMGVGDLRARMHRRYNDTPVQSQLER